MYDIVSCSTAFLKFLTSDSIPQRLLHLYYYHYSMLYKMNLKIKCVSLLRFTYRNPPFIYWIVGDTNTTIITRESTSSTVMP